MKKTLRREGIKPPKTPRRSFLTDIENLAKAAEDEGRSTPPFQLPIGLATPLQHPTFRDNFVPGGRPKASDYVEDIEILLVRAMHDYACRIRTINSFPDENLQMQWALSAWRDCCEIAQENYNLTPRMMRLVSKNFLLYQPSSL